MVLAGVAVVLSVRFFDFDVKTCPACRLRLCNHVDGYKRVEGRSHPVEKRPNMHPHKPHATSQPSRLCKRVHLRKFRLAISMTVCSAAELAANVG